MNRTVPFPLADERKQQILNVLQQKKECSLTHLSAKTGLTKSCVQRDFEMYLQKHSLMEIGRGGRTLTQKGHKYLEDAKKYLAERSKKVAELQAIINRQDSISQALKKKISAALFGLENENLDVEFKNYKSSCIETRRRMDEA